MTKKNGAHVKRPEGGGLSGKKVLIAVLLLTLVLSASGGVLAKYISRNVQKAEMVSAGFHISSNYLKEASSTSYNVGAADTLTIDLYNYEIENTAQRTEVPIAYNVTVTGGTLAAGQASGTFGTTADQTHTLTVTPAASTVTVTVTTTSPYAKTLRASFNLGTQASPSYTLTALSEEQAGAMLLKLHTNGYSGPISIVCNIAPDNANALLEGVATRGTATFTVQPNETYELLFFGSASAVTTETYLAASSPSITVGT